MSLLLFTLLVLLVSLLMSQQKSMTELGVVMVAYLGCPAYFEDIVKHKFFLIFFEGGWGEAFLFLTSDLFGGTIVCGFPP